MRLSARRWIRGGEIQSFKIESNLACAHILMIQSHTQSRAHRDKEIFLCPRNSKKLRENHPHSFLISPRRMPYCFAPTNKAAAAAAASGNKQISTTIFFVKNRPHWNVIYTRWWREGETLRSSFCPNIDFLQVP